MPWEPPKTDWTTNPKAPEPADFNRIEGNIAFLRQDIETKKGLIVQAIQDMNQPAELTDTHAELADLIRAISTDATATPADVEEGKTFYSGGEKKTGALLAKAIIQAGFHYDTDEPVGEIELAISEVDPSRAFAIVACGTVAPTASSFQHAVAFGALKDATTLALSKFGARAAITWYVLELPGIVSVQHLSGTMPNGTASHNVSISPVNTAKSLIMPYFVPVESHPSRDLATATFLNSTTIKLERLQGVGNLPFRLQVVEFIR